MALTKPQSHLLMLLNRYDVHFLIIGGYALLAHGVIRPTRDIDIWLSRSLENAKKIGKAFERIRAPAPRGGDWVAAFTKENARYSYPDDGPRKEGDLLTSIAGMDFEECYARSIQVDLDGMAVRAVGLDDLIALKRISAESGNDKESQARDRADLDALSHLRKESRR